MKSIFQISTTIALALLLTVACSHQKEPNTAEEAGEEADEAVEEAGEKIDEAAEDTAEAAEEAADDAEDAAKKRK